MKNSKLLLLLLICLCSCHYASKNSAVNDSTIVIITESAPESKHYRFKEFRVANPGNIVYVDTSLYVVPYKLRPVAYDTITIFTDRDNFEVRHDYSLSGRIYYLLNRGDTVMLTYNEKKIPYARILNREYNEYELNYDFLIANRTPLFDSLSAGDAFFYYSVVGGVNKNYLPVKEAAEKSYKNDLSKQFSYLDSLKNNQLISDGHYTYRKNNISSDLFLRKQDSSDSLFLKYDSLIYRDFYRGLLNNRIRSFFKPSYDPNNTPNWAKIEFDSIIYSPNYSNTIKRFVFQHLANREIDNLRDRTLNDDLQKMLADYATITGDSLTYHKLKEQFGLLKPDSLEISLKNSMGNVTSLSKVLEKHRGKYVFVDFWATWCLPCQALLPDNAKLEKEYKGKNIVFVTLAFNDDEKRWKEFISEKSGLFDSENYIITNTKSSRIIEKWGIRSIPRYMLFDEKGNIAILDAPRPNTKEIRNVFNKVLE